MVAELTPPAPEWAALPVGAELAGVLERVDPAGLDDSPVVDVVVAAERQIAHLRALQLRAMAQLTGRPNYARCGGRDGVGSPRHTHDPVRAVGSELSAALAWTPGHADTGSRSRSNSSRISPPSWRRSTPA